MILGSRSKGGPLGWKADLSDFELPAQGGPLGWEADLSDFELPAQGGTLRLGSRFE